MINKFQKIILIDDDEINTILTKAVIEDFGFAEEVLTFCDGQEAIDYLKIASGEEIKSAHLIILDLNMPVMDGEDFLKEFLNLPLLNKDKFKIVLLSALLPSKKYDYLKSLGVEEFMEKPLTDERIAFLFTKLGLSVV